MPDGVLPALLVLPVVREVLHYVVVDAAQGELSLWAGANGHYYQCVVREWRLLVLSSFLLVVSYTLFVVSFLFPGAVPVCGFSFYLYVWMYSSGAGFLYAWSAKEVALSFPGPVA